MKHSSNLHGVRPRWPLRTLLSLLLIVLVGIGVAVKHDDRAPAATTTSTIGTTTTTTSRDTTTTEPSTTTTKPTTTTTLRRATTASSTPVLNPAAFDQARHGCGFKMAMPPTSTTTSTPTTTTTHHESTTTEPPSSESTTTSTAPTTTTTRPAPTTTAPTRGTALGHCTVLEIGDSLGNDLGWGLQRQLDNIPGLRLIQEDKSSSGLANTGFYDWPTRLKLYLAQYHPDLTIVFLGGNDQQGFIEHGHAVQFPTEPWQQAYGERILKIASLATNAHSYVLWVGMPIMGPTQYSNGMVILNRLYSAVGTSVPGVTFLPTWSLFANAQGQFQMGAQIGSTRQLLRASDGIHFSYVGENVLATYVTEQMAAIYHVTLRPASPVRITG